MDEKVIVITINYNQTPMTIECINSILTSEDVNFLVLAIDNGSTKENYVKLEDYYRDKQNIELRRIENNIGYVRGVNFGLSIAKKYDANYYLVMNNDTIIDSKAIYNLAQTCKNYNNNAIVSGKVYHFDRPDVFQYLGSYFLNRRFLKEVSPGLNEKDIGQYDNESERDMLDDIFWLMPAKLIDEVGYYCDYFFLYAEQADLALRAQKKGYKMIYTPKAKIWHKGSITTGNGDRYSLPVCYWRSKSSFIYLFRNIKVHNFVFLIIKSLSKHLLNATLNRSNSRSKNIAFIRGSLAGFKWLFTRKPDNGFNPYIK